ncbi:MAG: phage terminase large subunit [Trueperaceae bacterium]|nr:phage terminase large subunit [Trueperaceae bacterium]
MQIINKMQGLQRQARKMQEVRRHATALTEPLSGAEKANARADLKAYFRLARGLEPAPHQVEILDGVQTFVERCWSAPPEAAEGLHIMTVNLPPGAGKSMTISQTLPEWVLGNRPWERILVVSAAADLATLFQTVTKATIEHSALYREVFPDERARPDKTRGWSNDALYLKGLPFGEASPSIMAAGLQGSILGKRATLIIIDDPQTPVTNTKAGREKTWQLINGTVLSRGVSGAPILCVQQRLHEDDVTGKLQRHYGASSIVIRALDEDGSSFWPQGMSARLLQQKRQADPHIFEAMYQQNPTGGTGDVFKPAWFRYHDSDLAAGLTRLQSWDTAQKAGQKNDYNAYVEALVDEHKNIYVTDMGWKRLEFPDLVSEVKRIGERGPRLVLIEDKASGSSLTQTLRATTSLPLLPVSVESDKVARANATTGWFEAGKVLFPQHHPLLAEFEAFLTTFPQGAHDDPVDALTQLIGYVIGHIGAAGSYKAHKARARR